MSEPYLPPELAGKIAVRVDTAAAVLECGRSTIYDRVAAGDLSFVRIGSSRARRIPVADLLALLRPDTGEHVDTDPLPAPGFPRPEAQS